MAQQQSTIPLVIAGTAAVHLLIAVAIDVASVVGREEEDDETDTLSLVDIDTSQLPPPPPEPPPEVLPEEPPVTPPPVETPQVQPRRTAPRTPRADVPPPSTPLPTVDPTPTAGGGAVVNLPGIAPAARGVAAGTGKPTTGRLGRGGKGGGRGTGDGGGDGPGTAPVVAASISSIKTPAVPKEGFDYFDAATSYPAEARRLGIEGKLRVRLTVDVAGKVVAVKLLGSLGHGLDELALSRARAIRFTPALDPVNKPVASTVVWTFTFTLPSDT